MGAATVDLVEGNAINQGSTFVMTITITSDGTAAIDITGFTARMQLRETHGSANTVVSLTSGAGDITNGGANGVWTVTITSAVTTALTARSYVYDFEHIDGAGAVTRIIEGTATVTPEVTR